MESPKERKYHCIKTWNLFCFLFLHIKQLSINNLAKYFYKNKVVNAQIKLNKVAKCIYNVQQ